MGYLDKEFETMGGMDGLADAYQKKKDLLRNERRESGSAELRYMFNGAVLPKGVEEEAKLLRRNFHNLQAGKLTDGTTTLIIKAIENGNVEKGVQQAINFTTEKGQEERLLIHEKVQPFRGEFPMTEFIYNDKLYTSLPKHGDVLNHTFNQHEEVIKKLLIRAEKEGIISQEEFPLYEDYHIGHDVGEISADGKDIISFEKELQLQNGEINEDNAEYKKMLVQSGKFSKQQINFSSKLFNLLDHKKSLIGGFEKLMYLVTALDAYEIKDKTNSGVLLTTAVIGNFIKEFTEKGTHDLQLYNLLGSGKDRTIPLSEIQPAKDYFTKNRRKIEEIIKFVQENKNEFTTGALEYVFYNTHRNQNSNIEEQNRTKLLKNLDNSLISLQKSLETIKKEQDNIKL